MMAFVGYFCGSRLYRYPIISYSYALDGSVTSFVFPARMKCVMSGRVLGALREYADERLFSSCDAIHRILILRCISRFARVAVGIWCIAYCKTKK